MCSLHDSQGHWRSSTFCLHGVIYLLIPGLTFKQLSRQIRFSHPPVSLHTVSPTRRAPFPGEIPSSIGLSMSSSAKPFIMFGGSIPSLFCHFPFLRGARWLATSPGIIRVSAFSLDSKFFEDISCVFSLITPCVGGEGMVWRINPGPVPRTWNLLQRDCLKSVMIGSLAWRGKKKIWFYLSGFFLFDICSSQILSIWWYIMLFLVISPWVEIQFHLDYEILEGRPYLARRFTWQRHV